MRISIHAPTRGATGGKDIIGGASEISIHAPTRGATDECRAWKEKHNAFQSTLPRGERPNCFDHCQGEMDISIHAPTRGATLTDLGYEVQFKISIHAPTRGATDVYPCRVIHRSISIHAPTRGATFKDCYRLLCWIFQSTLPRGERQYFHFCSKMLKKISIHAPTRGATTFPGTFRSTYNYFNPRSHEGSDRK